MRVIADLHIHSRFSRATSSELNITNLVKFARMKGVNLLGTGDLTYPSWLRELKDELHDDGGILKSADGFPFILSGEISSIYSQNGSVKRIHNIVLCPDFETAGQINDALRKKGVNLDSDGRPICGIPSPDLVEILMSINPLIEVIPAHCLTPWFSVFGSKSGFDTVEECFQDQTKHIHALETGLSANPSMIWRNSKWSDYTLVSFSDSHSFWPWRIGREATVFDVKELTYDNIIKAIRTKEGLTATLEFFPEEGKYHYDGHRDCNVSLAPKESEKLRNICPVCRRPLTIGVLHRAEELADRPEGFVPENAKPFHSLVPLSEIIASVTKANVSSGRVWEEYSRLVNAFGSELNVLMEADGQRLAAATDGKIAGMILKARAGSLKIRPGYDGVYGEIEAGAKTAKKRQNRKMPQKCLGDF